jgi:AcrR family transcriptional regulator
VPGRPSSAQPRKKRGVTPDLIIRTALQIADRDGLDAVTMRAIAEAIEITAMSLYHHVPTKDAILDAMADAVYAEVDLHAGDQTGWRPATEAAARSLRDALLRHPWALRLVESRAAPGEATMRHHDTVLGFFRDDGFSVPATALAIALLDSYIYGFVLQEINLPFDDQTSAGDVADQILAVHGATAYPHLREIAAELVTRPGYSFGGQFGPGLDLVLDAIGRLRA